MIKSKQNYLTIDDGPTEHTREIVDYLKKNNIPAIMFFCGENINRYPEAAVYTIENGFIIGNHSYEHKYFSSTPLTEAMEDINRCEDILDSIYSQAAVKRELKLFRFPFGDKGYEWTGLNVLFRKFNSKYIKLQRFLAEKQFDKLPVNNFQQNMYYRMLLNDIDVFWTFDTNDWQLGKREYPDFGYRELDKQLGKLKNRPKNEIILTHDRPDTPEHLYYIVDKLKKEGYEFNLPEPAGI